MRVLWKSSCLALAACGVLAACDTEAPGAPDTEDREAVAGDDVSPEFAGLPASRAAAFEALKTEDYSEEGGEPADIDSLISLVPEPLAIDYADMSFDETSGATVISDLAISFQADGAEPVGYRFSEIKVWGLDSEFILARLGGERLDETGTVFTRLEFTDAAVFGMSDFLTDMANTYGEELDLGMSPDFDLEEFEELEDLETREDLEELGEDAGDAAEAADDAIESAEMPSVSFETLDFTIGRGVMTGFALKPYAYTPPAALDELAEDERALPTALLQAVAIANSLQMEASVTWDMTLDFAMTQDGQDFGYRFDYPATGSLGMDGIGYDFSFSSPLDYTGEIAFPELGELTDEPVYRSVPISGSQGLSTVRDLDLRKAADYLVRLELPPMSERDLWSLGQWSLDGVSQSWDGEQIFSMGLFELDLREADWFIPTDARLSVEDFAYNISGLVSMMSGMMEGGDGEAEMMQAEFDKAVAIMERHDIGRIAVDVALDWTWQSDDGPLNVNWNGGLNDLLTETGTLDIILPDYDTLEAASVADDPDMAFEEAFEQSFAFVSFEDTYRDTGFLDMLFPLLKDIGESYVEQQPDLAMLANSEPEQMRTMAASIIGMAGAQAASELPQATDWFMAASDFIKEGGSLTISAKPDEPVTPASAAEFEAATPGEIAERMNVSVTHEAP